VLVAVPVLEGGELAVVEGVWDDLAVEPVEVDPVPEAVAGVDIAPVLDGVLPEAVPDPTGEETDPVEILAVPTAGVDETVGTP